MVTEIPGDLQPEAKGLYVSEDLQSLFDMS